MEPQNLGLRSSLPRRAGEVLLILVVVVVLVNNVTLRRQLAVREQMPSATAFRPGERFDPIGVADARGEKSRFPHTKDRRVVAIVDPTCRSCEKNVRTATPGDVILSVAPASLLPSLQQRTRATVFALADASRDRRFGPVPQVLLIEGDRVLRTCAEVNDCR